MPQAACRKVGDVAQQLACYSALQQYERRSSLHYWHLLSLLLQELYYVRVRMDTIGHARIKYVGKS